MELTLKEICVLLTEHVRTIEATFPVIQHSATSARYISIFINGSTITTHNSIQKSSLITLKHRKIAGALRSAMHLQSNLNKVIRLKSVKIISQLLRISMFDKQRGNRSFLLAHSISFTHITLTILTCRNIFLTNLMPIQSSKCETLGQFIKKNSSIRNAIKMEKEAIALLSTQTNSGNIALHGVHITANALTIFIFLAQKVIIFSKFRTYLTIGGKINTEFINLIRSINTYSITETFAEHQPIGIIMFS